MLAETIAAASMGQSTIFVDAGRNDELPDFIFVKGSSFKQYTQKLDHVCVPWDKCTLTAADIVVLPNVAPGQFVQMFSKKQRLQINQEVILIEVGYCNDTLQLNKIEQKHHQDIGLIQALSMAGFQVAFVKDVHSIPLVLVVLYFASYTLYCVPFKFLLPLCRIYHIAFLFYFYSILFLFYSITFLCYFFLSQCISNAPSVGI
jgi:hypothetical protein